MIPGGIGLLYLARGLAIERTSCHLDAAHWRPLDREFLQSWPHIPLVSSREYYAILDRISRGEKP
jgi:hypothetical protein